MGLIYAQCVLGNFAFFANSLKQYHTWRPIVFIQPGVQDMSIIIYAFKVSVERY